MASTTLFNGADAVTHDGLDGIPGRIGRSSLLWLDVGRTDADLRRVAELVEIDDATVRQLVDEQGTAPSLVDRPDYTFVSAQVPERESERTKLARVDCVVGERWVVTVHDRPVAVLDEFRERAMGSGATGRLDGPSFLATLLEWVLGEYARSFEQIEAQLEDLDIRALEGALDDPERELRRLVELRRDVGALRRYLAAHREPLVSLTHPELDALSSDESAHRFRNLVERFDVTLQAGRDARESIVGSFDVIMARTEHRTNEILKVLTLASVLFLPGSLMAGILGMNFRVSLFDHPSVFWIVVSVVLAIILATSAVARMRRWV